MSTAAQLDPIPREHLVTLRLNTAPGTHLLRFFGLDTDIQISMRCGAEQAKAVSGQAIEATRRLERLLSRFLPNSDISRLNAAAGAPIPIAGETYDLLERALEYCERSCGAFDITAGAATRLWDFKAGLIPDPRALAAACAHVDWRAVELLGRGPGEAGGSVRLADPEAAVDLGGVAKGYIADTLSDLLLGEGVFSHLICLGGNVVARGTRDDAGSPWQATVPGTAEDGQGLELRDCSVVTSGIGERSFERGGVLYHHILDPRTGMPAQTDLASATVVARRSIDAEGYSTTLLSLGSACAESFARARPEILEARLVTQAGRFVLVA